MLLERLRLDVSQLLSALRIFYSYRLFCSEKYVGIFVFFNHKQFIKLCCHPYRSDRHGSMLQRVPADEESPGGETGLR